MENPKSHPALFQTQCLTTPQGHNYKASIQRLELDSTDPFSLLDKTLEKRNLIQMGMLCGNVRELTRSDMGAAYI